jgi:hypothetical protein
MNSRIIPETLVETVKAKLLTKIQVLDNGCWIYLGNTNDGGYPTWRPYPTSKVEYVHRCSYEIFNGPIPEGLEPDHTCKRRNCINPEHLEAVTRRVNVLRSDNPAGINARKTHCIRGHEFTPENTYPNGRDRKGRGCVACRNMRNAGRI